MSDMMGRMMEKVAGQIPQERMQGLMQDMMAHMFEDMTVDDRVEFMRSLMAVCLPTLTEGMDADAKAAVLREMSHLLAGAPGHSDRTADAQQPSPPDSESERP
ncbi:MAG: hypothetical protein ACP5QO_15055 [Clostridia bacterium]